MKQNSFNPEVANSSIKSVTDSLAVHISKAARLRPNAGESLASVKAWTQALDYAMEIGDDRDNTVLGFAELKAAEQLIQQGETTEALQSIKSAYQTLTEPIEQQEEFVPTWKRRNMNASKWGGVK